MSKHVAVWIDHKEARIFSFNAEKADERTIVGPPAGDHQQHTHGQAGLKAHPEDTKRFYHELVGALQGTDELLIVGPAAAKLELLRYMHQQDHLLESKVVGIETVDHPSDSQVVAYAKKYFTMTDRML